MTTFDYEALNPGIRETVRWVHSLGYETTDSGDGVTNKAAGMECATDFPMVAIVSDPYEVIRDSKLLWEACQKIGWTPQGIEATWSPVDQTAFILLIGVKP